MGNLCGSPMLSCKVRKGTKSEGSAHPLPVIDETNGMIITERIQAPSHFVWKIESYSTLLQSGWEKIESGCFEVDGRKWKLTFHPNNVLNQKGFGNISLYLSVLDTEELPISWDLFVNFKFFVFDQIRDKYLVIQDAHEVCRFQRMRKECGFAKLLPFTVFINPSNGYLLNDCCVFGVDIFVIKGATRGESFSVVKPRTSGNSYTFKIEKFSTIDKEYVESNVFTIEGIKWMLRFYPKANRDGIDMVDLYLFLASNLEDCNNKVYATCTVRMIDQGNGIINLTPTNVHVRGRVISCPSASTRRGTPFAAQTAAGNAIRTVVDQAEYGFSNECGFLIFSNLLRHVNDASKGFLVNDTILLKVTFGYVSNVKHCS